MIVAICSVHLKNGFFAASNGIELPFLVVAAALGIVFTGGGEYSLDAWLGIKFLSEPYLVWEGLVLTFVGAALNLALRKRDQAKTVAA
jgi:hypothetical protein